VADAIKRDLNLVAEQVVGNTGEFTVWVDGIQVASKQGDQFPKDADVVQAVKERLAPR
jgi:predicted Rdx family selenoprotein